MSGIICGNFGISRTGTNWTCTSVFHAKCYAQHPNDGFPRLQPSDLEDCLLDPNSLNEDDATRFTSARDGDQFMTPFQCDICQFINIHNRLPNRRSHQDNLLLLCIRRVILDSFWSREPSTVHANWLEGNRFRKIQKNFGLEMSSLPPQGPFPVKDDWGVNVACCMVLRSLDEGKNAQHIQFCTVRKMRSFVSNYSHASRNGLGFAFMNDDGSGSCISYLSTNSL